MQKHGIKGLLRMVGDHFVRFANKLRPSVRTEILARQQRAADFDQRFGVDTGGWIHQTELNVNNPNQLHAGSYLGSDPKFFRDSIESLPIDYRHFVFIDFGSGKGRAIMLATEYSFKRVIGVEFSEDLHRIAQENIKRFPNSMSKCKDVECICIDAVAYPLPDDGLVCYFFNPFDATLMAQVLSNIRASFLRKPREIFIVYYNPREGHLVNQVGCFQKVGASGPVEIWRTTLES